MPANAGIHLRFRFNPNPAEEMRTASEEQTFRSKDKALCL
jgi:hypothetical protein